MFRKWRLLAKSASSVSNSIYVDQCKVRGNAQNREEPVRAEFTSSTIKCISYQSNIVPISSEKSYGPDSTGGIVCSPGMFDRVPV